MVDENGSLSPAPSVGNDDGAPSAMRGAAAFGAAGNDAAGNDAAGLAAADALLSAFGDTMSDLLFAKDRAGRYLYANPAALAVIGRPLGQVLGQADDALLSAADAEAVMRSDRHVMDSGQPDQREQRVLDVNRGETRVWQTARTPVRNPADGRVVGLVGISRDVTEQREALAAAAENDAQLRELLATIDLGAFMARDMDGIVRHWSAGCTELYGWRADEAVGRISHELLHTQFPVPLAEIEARLRQRGRWSGDLRHRTRDGRELVVAVRKLLRHDANGHERILELLADATAQRQAEAALGRMNEELEERVRVAVAAAEAAQAIAAQAQHMNALGELAGGVAHEFNNILQAVQGGARLIEQRASDPASVEKFARIVLKASERGTQIASRLLNFARRADVKPERVEPAAFLNEVGTVLSRTLGDGIAVRTDVQFGLRSFVADKAQLQGALISLAANARDAMPEGGMLTLAAAEEVVPAGAAPDGPAPGRYIRIRVGDTGRGMDAATLKRSVEPFFSTKPLGTATGLGLSMAKGFAEQSGGALRLESVPGAGTTVTVWFPSAGGSLAHAPDAAGEAAPRRVLVVDDEELIRETLAAILEDAGFRVGVAADGAEALATLAESTFDIVLSDFSMPGMNGFEFIREARTLRPTLPAVMLTGYASMLPDDAIPAALPILRKPVQPGALIAQLEALLVGVCAAA